MNAGEIQILVVDDEPLNLEILIEYLEETPYKPIVAKNGIEAWKLLTNSPEDAFAAVLLDRMMPDMSGMEILHKIKSEPKYKGLPVIMQTAAAGKQDMLEGLRAGAYYYLTKPFEKDMLLSIVETAINDWKHYILLKQEVQKGVQGMGLMDSGTFVFRTLDESRTLAAFLANACPESERVVLGLSELMINAIEHGNLGISYDEKTELLSKDTWLEEVNKRLVADEHSDKLVKVDFQRLKNNIEIRITDQGVGFDWQRYEEMTPDRVSHRHGRGIAIANLLSFNKIEYKAPGNEVACYISLDQESDEAD